MQFQNPAHGCSQPIKRNIVIGLFAGTNTVTRVKGSVGIKKKGSESKVWIELKLLQIQAVTFNQSNIDKLFGGFLQLIVETDNLPIKSAASVSGDATQDDHQRLALSARERLCFLQIVVNPVAIVRHSFAIIQHHLIARQFLVLTH